MVQRAPPHKQTKEKIMISVKELRSYLWSFSDKAHVEVDGDKLLIIEQGKLKGRIDIRTGKYSCNIKKKPEPYEGYSEFELYYNNRA